MKNALYTTACIIIAASASLFCICQTTSGQGTAYQRRYYRFEGHVKDAEGKTGIPLAEIRIADSRKNLHAGPVQLKGKDAIIWGKMMPLHAKGVTGLDGKFDMIFTHRHKSSTILVFPISSPVPKKLFIEVSKNNYETKVVEIGTKNLSSGKKRADLTTNGLETFHLEKRKDSKRTLIYVNGDKKPVDVRISTAQGVDIRQDTLEGGKKKRIADAIDTQQHGESYVVTASRNARNVLIEEFTLDYLDKFGWKIVIPDRKYTAKIEWLKLSAEATSKLVQLHNDLGNAYDYGGILGKAIEEYETALSLYPDTQKKLRAGVYFNIGLMFRRDGLYNDAIRNYLKAIEKDPSLKGAYLNLGVVYRQKGMYKEAIGVYKKGLTQHEQDVSFIENLAIACQESGQRREAKKNWQRALEIRKKMSDTLENRRWKAIAEQQLRRLR